MTFTKALALVLIGSDYPHLVLPIEPVCIGSMGRPVAVCTALGWTVQGPALYDPSTGSSLASTILWATCSLTPPK